MHVGVDRDTGRIALQSLALGLAAAAFTMGLSSCNRTQTALYERILSVEESGYEGAELSNQAVSELKDAIRMLEEEVDRTVDAGERLGVYYKLVGLRFLDQEMYGLALEYFEKALEIYPTNSYLAYMAGLSAGTYASSRLDPLERDSWFDRAEAYYRYAVRLKSKYVEALYALAVLYVFERPDPAEAQSLLERILGLEEYNFNAMFLLARVYVSNGMVDPAVELYDRIARKSPSSEQQSQASQNIRSLLEAGRE